MKHKRTATQHGLNIVLITSVIILFTALFIPKARELAVLSVIPLITGAITAILIGISRKMKPIRKTA